jgi:hypothetical protein
MKNEQPEPEFARIDEKDAVPAEAEIAVPKVEDAGIGGPESESVLKRLKIVDLDQREHLHGSNRAEVATVSAATSDGSGVQSFARKIGRRLLQTIGTVIGSGDDAISVATGSANRQLPKPGRIFITLDQLEQLCLEQPGDYLVQGLLPPRMFISLWAIPA